MSKSKKTTVRKFSNPAPFSSKPKFGQVGSNESSLQNMAFATEAIDEAQLKLINPLRVITLVKSVCRTCHMYCSPRWRTSEQTADQDARSHINLGHWTAYTYKYVTQNH